MAISGLRAQSEDKFLDDAYMTRSQVEQLNAKARAEAAARAEERYQARLAEEKALAEERQRILEAYKQRIRDREIDAYNGRISAEDSLADLQLQRDLARLDRRSRAASGDVTVYGPYSARLKRFHGDGQVVIVDADEVYIEEGSPYGDTHISINYHGRSGFYPWYDGYRTWGYHHPYYSWRYRSGYYPYGYYGTWYDPWVDPWFDYPWGGPYYTYYPRHYGGFYFGGVYGGIGFYYDQAIRYRDYYDHNDYRHGARSTYAPSGGYTRPVHSTAYGSFQSARRDMEAGGSGVFSDGYRGYSGHSTAGSSYRGRGRSTYTGAVRQDSYNSGTRGYTNSPRSSSYDSSSSSRSSSSFGESGSSSSSRSSGGGGSSSMRGRR